MDVKIDELLEELGIDAATLNDKYRIEREKRVRADGASQFVDISGQYAHYGEDPWVGGTPDREALTDEVDVVVIGGGLSAILAGVNLRKGGVKNLRFIERAADFGGVWYWNRYPGAACDTQAVLYLPMLEELGVMPKERFATQSEILSHFQMIARKFELYSDVCFQTEVEDVSWDDESSRWTVSTDRNDKIRARYVVVTSGAMMRPKLPGIPGIADFKGHSFHSSRWDYSYTGGTSQGGMTGLADKRVGVIGTGATAVQIIPKLAESAQHLYVFQRTPASIDIRANREFDPQSLHSLEPGWHKDLLDNFSAQTTGILTDEDLVGDGWTSLMTNIRMLMQRAEARGETVSHPMELMQIADYMKMEEIRARVDEVVKDPATAEALKPWYNRFCKRPCFSDEYLPTFNRPNVTLVDTAGRGVEKITQDAILVDGQSYPIDCLVYSTGFEVGAAVAKHISYSIHGRGGKSLLEKWENGALTQHGIMTNGFPNLFIMSTAQTGISFNFSHVLQEQANHIGFLISRLIADGVIVAELTLEAEEAWMEEVDRTSVSMEPMLRDCTPSYMNFEGDIGRIHLRDYPYGGGPFAFWKILGDWRKEGTMKGLQLTHRER